MNPSADEGPGVIPLTFRPSIPTGLLLAFQTAAAPGAPTAANADAPQDIGPLFSKRDRISQLVDLLKSWRRKKAPKRPAAPTENGISDHPPVLPFPGSSIWKPAHPHYNTYMPSTSVSELPSEAAVLGNLVDYAIDPDSLELEGTEPVARGGCGEVWIARLRQPRNPPAEFPPPGQSGRVAVKKLKLSKTAKIGKKRFAREAMIWAGAQHMNILPFWGYYVDEEGQTAWLISPWEDAGNIIQYLAKAPRNETLLLDLIADTARGLQYLHYRLPVVCHGDLKGANVLIEVSPRPGVRPQALLCDFGLAKILDEGFKGLQTTDAWKGSIPWCAPELLEGGPRTTESDIWAWGHLVWEARPSIHTVLREPSLIFTCQIMTGRLPFDETTNPAALILKIVRGEIPTLAAEQAFDHYPALAGLLQRCWKQNPLDRPRIADCTSGLLSLIGPTSSPVRP